MSKRAWFLLLLTCLTVGIASGASAATSWKVLGGNPFSRPPLNTEADLRTMVQNRSVDLKTGFARAGYPGLYPAFMEQFPTAKIDSVTIAIGDTFEWIVFKKKTTGRVTVLKDATWKGPVAFGAYHFSIDSDGKRHEFVVPYACGNVALRSVAPIPPPPATAAAPAPAPPAPAVAPRLAAVSAPPVAVAAADPARQAPAPAPPSTPAPKAPVPAPLAPKPVAVPPSPPPPPPVAMWRGGLLFDVGLSHQLDPANYVFARIGYEVPLSEKLYLMGFLGGSLRWMGHDGGNAFTADVLLDYHWLGRHFVGVGAGFWSGNGGQADLIADVGYRLFGTPEGSNSSLFLEARLPVDELGSVYEFGRFGLGMRFRF